MKIENAVALVTGSNRGIGKAIVEALSKRRVKKVYAAMRNTETFRKDNSNDLAKLGRAVELIDLDIVKKDQIQAVVQSTGDINLLINNAGVANYSGLIAENDLDSARYEMEVNYFGTLAMIRAFAPILKKNGGGSIVNILSVASLVNFPILGSYSASKAALLSLTQGVRAELTEQGTNVIGIYPGPIDTDMAKGIDMEKSSPEETAEGTLDAIERGDEDVFIDQMAVQFYKDFRNDPKAVEKQCGEMLPQTVS
jgi:NAD(P)-dependent dehydrogenase (short-subunit alcohol dehydrogenase family)